MSLCSVWIWDSSSVIWEYHCGPANAPVSCPGQWGMGGKGDGDWRAVGGGGHFTAPIGPREVFPLLHPQHAF